MNTLVKVPIEFVEMLAEWQLPPKSEARLRALNAVTDRRLTDTERAEWEALLELVTSIAWFRAQASHFLGRDLVA